ncbi:prepilin-type N-terminal cleavage/methylation domain-containing protein [Halomonas elongata]|uniref:prepilin-type N-terminal cleavage/methylation domain-containing protein n=1 Tax=Halomonas elongata TaxID=2746 RepID=UPI0023B18BFA|nr:GspH/FimT family pseudopilin [Halomonas elongata]
MRQPPSRHRQAGAQSGFSLLELLIVLTIIAALAGLSVAWLDGDAGPTLDSARERLRIDLERAAIQAMEQQRVIGLLPGATGYTFVTRDAGSAEWQTLEAKALPARQWQLDIHLQRDPSAPEDSMVPWLVWWPDGEVLGGHLDLVSGDRRRRLVIDALGVRETMVQDATERDDA